MNLRKRVLGTCIFTAICLLSAPSRAQFDPIVLDLDGDGLDFGGTVATDLVSDTEQTLRWTTAAAEDCFVAVDATTLRESTGFALRSSSGATLDGVVLLRGGLQVEDPTQTITTATSGAHALELFDGNGDGRIDPNDAFWSAMQLFMDYDNNGRISNPELHRPETVLITWGSIVVGPPTPDPWGNIRRDGTWHTATGDVLSTNVQFEVLSVSAKNASWAELKSAFPR